MLGRDGLCGFLVIRSLRRSSSLRWPLHQLVRRTQLTCVQGKWLLERRPDGGTALKYAVEIAMGAAPLRAIGLVEPLLDRTAAEDVPVALAAIKRVAEGSAVSVRDAAGVVPAREIATFDDLRAELTVLFGHSMVMPDRRALLERGRCALCPALRLGVARALSGV